MLQRLRRGRWAHEKGIRCCPLKAHFPVRSPETPYPQDPSPSPLLAMKWVTAAGGSPCYDQNHGTLTHSRPGHLTTASREGPARGFPSHRLVYLSSWPGNWGKGLSCCCRQQSMLAWPETQRQESLNQRPQGPYFPTFPSPIDDKAKEFLVVPHWLRCPVGSLACLKLSGC